MNAVRAFEAAGRYVSFTKAANELAVTHGAVSRQVQLLEAFLGVPLFHRSASQLSLTEAGRTYLAEVTAALDRLALASMHLADQAAPTALRVSAPPTFAMRWLIARLSTFQRRHPTVEMRITTSIAPVSFHDNVYDIAIRGAPAPLPSFVSKPFMTELIVAVCHADLAEKGQLRTPADLAAHTLLSYATQSYGWAQWLEAVGLPDLHAAKSLTFEQMYFALQAAVDGLGVVLVPLFLVIDDILAGRLCTPFGDLGAKQRRYFAFASHKTPSGDAFFDWLLREGRDTERSMVEFAQAAGWSGLSLRRAETETSTEPAVD